MSEQHTEESPAQLISSTGYIAALLQRLQTERRLIDVTLGASATPLTSTLLQILPHGAGLLLDEPFPRDEASPDALNTEFRVTARFEGATLRFSVTLEAFQDEAGARLWHTSLPQSMEYWQARSEHRVVVLPLQIPLRLYIGEGVVLHGVLYDLCGHGVGIRLAGAVAGLKRGKVYRCAIDQGGAPPLEMAITLNRAGKVAGEWPVELGAQLHNMPRPQQHQWQRFAAEMERRLLRQ